MTKDQLKQHPLYNIIISECVDGKCTVELIAQMHKALINDPIDLPDLFILITLALRDLGLDEDQVFVELRTIWDTYVDYSKSK